MQLDLFSLDFSDQHFEKFSNENGFTYWWATDLMEMLGYKTWEAFKKIINKAISVLATLEISSEENFQLLPRVHPDSNKKISDYKLSRFACYLVAMNADPKKEFVAKAQVYFAQLAGAFQNYLDEVNKVERLDIREQISEHEKSFNSAFKNAQGTNYAFFQNAGYRGLYNTNINTLRQKRGIDIKRSPLDFMGKIELSANLLRINLTENKISSQPVIGQNLLEQAAEKIGQNIRNLLVEENIFPEHLPVEKDIREVKKELKKANKTLTKIDKKKLPPAQIDPPVSE
jgi:DNA-damage-inducible protein D